MAPRETFEPRLMALLTRSPQYHEEWLRITSGPGALTPTGLRVVLWSMADEGIISPAELTELLAQLEQEGAPPLRADPRRAH
jgi:hypothetical protein